jgi:glycyl-tRNA synthetase beta subunit
LDRNRAPRRLAVVVKGMQQGKKKKKGEVYSR